MHTFHLAGGCFWCLDAVYRTLNGVTDVVSGYTGGTVPNPSYELVCTETTGHAEAVAVTFDPEVIPDEVILDVYFTLHDPRQLNRQGNDIGSSYRSAMFYVGDEQKALFEAARDRASEYWDGGIVTTIEPLDTYASEYWDGGIVTTIEPLDTYYNAEEYHQDFFAKNPGQGYCMAVALPKVNKIRSSFSSYIK